VRYNWFTAECFLQSDIVLFSYVSAELVTPLARRSTPHNEAYSVLEPEAG